VSAFASAEEAHRVVGEFFRRIAASKAGASVGDARIVAAFVFSDPAARIVLDGRSAPPEGSHFTVHVGNRGPAADVTFRMSSDEGERVFTGGVPIMVALMNGTVRASGALGKALPLVPAVNAWIPLYIKYRKSLR
jgi:hypothetical protein